MNALVAIVGRPNVGKSTLFNRIVRRRLAIVEEMPGVTRDRLFYPVDWDGWHFTLVDTGGLDLVGEARTPGFSERERLSLDEGGRAGSIATAVRRQALAAVAEADVVVFLVDGKEGVQPGDHEVAGVLRRSGKPVILAVNKLDNRKLAGREYEFYELGLGDPLPLSAEHGLNVGELLDQVVHLLPPGARPPTPVGDADAGDAPADDADAGDGKAGDADKEGFAARRRDDGVIRVAVVGRPNVGKSSLVNRLIGRDRVIVSDVPGTTRDAIDVRWKAHGRIYEFVDTAGMRRKARVETALEYYSVLRTLRAVDRSDVILLLLDATEGVTEQDKKIAGYGHEQGKACIILVNKWDLVEKDEYTINTMTEKVRQELAYLTYAPILFISAETGQRLGKLAELIDRVVANHRRRVVTAALNRILDTAERLHNPPSKRGRQLKIYYATQVAVGPPTFLLFVNDPELMHYSYERYLENQVRDAFDFEGTPITWRYRARRRAPLWNPAAGAGGAAGAGADGTRGMRGAGGAGGAGAVGGASARRRKVRSRRGRGPSTRGR